MVLALTVHACRTNRPIVGDLARALMWSQRNALAKGFRRCMETCLPTSLFMMTSSNGNIFRVTGHLCGKFTGPRWISRTNGQWRGALMFSLIYVWINDWANNREAGDLRRQHGHYDVIVMYWYKSSRHLWIPRETGMTLLCCQGNQAGPYAKSFKYTYLSTFY